MKKKGNSECPVNFIPVNQSRVQLVALFVFVLSAAYCLQPHWSLAVILVVDFFLRAFGFGRYSFLGWLSDWIIRKFSLPYKPVDGAPKEFAAQVGFLLSDLLFIISAFHLYDIGRYISSLLVCFSFLEAAFGFCAGCYIYKVFDGSFFKRLTGHTILP